MASNTQIHKKRKKNKLKKLGKERKRRIRAQGSTPLFPIHPETEQE